MCGLRASSWLALFWGSHSWTGDGFVRDAWPDGKPYLEQEHVVVVGFDVIKSQMLETVSARTKRH